MAYSKFIHFWQLILSPEILSGGIITHVPPSSLSLNPTQDYLLNHDQVIRLNQLGSKAASDSTLKPLTTCRVSNTCTLLSMHPPRCWNLCILNTSDPHPIPARIPVTICQLSGYRNLVQCYLWWRDFYRPLMSDETPYTPWAGAYLTTHHRLSWFSNMLVSTKLKRRRCPTEHLIY